MRDQNQKEALQRKAAQAQQKGQEAGEQEEQRSRSRRRKKKAGQSEGAPPPDAPSAALQDYEDPIRRSEPPKRGVRPGTLMDTGDAMPRTEFHRPNPLDSDVIMDATARLLAPRRSPLVPSRGGSGRKESPARAGRGQEGRESRPAAQPGQARRQKAKSRAGQQTEHKGASPKAPPEQKPGGKKRPSRPDKRRSQPPEPRRNGQPKDSTEQHSLMKPYYLDMGR